MTAFPFIGLLLFLAPIASAADWPQWRGSQRDGRATATLPTTWPDSLHLSWKVPVGIGHASPVVVGDSVYIHTRVDDSEVAACLDLANGTTLWQEGRAVPYEMNPAAFSHGKGPKSTPLVQGDRLYTLGITGILSSHDRHTGALQWRHDFAGTYSPTTPLYGTATSPLFADGLLITWVGGHDDGALRAFDAETGATRWSWAEDGPGYTSPIIVTIDGVKQLITQSQRFSLGFDPDTGKVLWQVPYATAWDQNSITPIAYGNLIVFSGIDMGITALRIIRVSKMGAAHSDPAPGDNWRTEQAWHNADLSMYMSSPVLDGHLLYGLSHKKMGQYFCLDTLSGETLWTSPGRQGENASLIDIGNQLLLFNTEAQLVIVDKDNTEFAVRHRYTVAQNSTWAHPAALDTRLLVKDATHLYLWSTE